jgi:hypothetical protein
VERKLLTRASAVQCRVRRVKRAAFSDRSASNTSQELGFMHKQTS